MKRVLAACLAAIFTLADSGSSGQERGSPSAQTSGSARSAPDSRLLATNTRKPWVRWWWPGSAVDRQSLTQQMEELARVGVGGVEITPIYGALGYESRYIEFLTPQFMAMLEHAGREGQRLGLGIDMATGTGWPFGGPWIDSAHALTRAVLRDGQLAGEPTKMMVKRAAPGGEGLVVNPFSPEALRTYLARFDTAFAGFPRGLVRAQFHDSFEYSDASWDTSLPAIFKEMHGYDIQDHAAELMDRKAIDADALGRIKSDFRDTLNRMHQSYLAEWKRWSHEHGFIVRNQSHGAPANLLDLYGLVDIPETEVFGSTPFPIPGLRRDPAAVRHDQDLPEPMVTRMASSAAHVMGRPLASSETATWLRDHWKVTLASVKPEVDRIFLDGVNHVFYHGTVFSPRDAPWPGWLFYASTQFNPNNSWWDDFASLNSYVERVQTVLQGGRPDNRVLLYWPIYDVWDDSQGLMQQLGVHDVKFIMGSRCGALARVLDEAGYAFDYISDDQIAATNAVSGKLATPGNTYDVLVVPRADRMPLATLRKLGELARGGATIVFDGLPSDVPGYGTLEQRRKEFRAILETWRFSKGPIAGVERAASGRGALLRGDVLSALRSSGTVREALADTPIDFIRRRTASGYDYFVANLTGNAFAGWVTLGVNAASATITDPLNGQSGVAALRRADPTHARIYLQLKPGESLLVSTSTRAATSGIQWTWLEPAGAAVPIAGTWNIEFIKGGPELPPAISTKSLASWTELGGEAAQRFAGTARYRIEFDAPARTADTWVLRLGDVRESARVRLNGRELATAWSLPFEVRLGDALRPGRNTLEIEVTNVAANRIRDMDRRGVRWKIMREINFVNIRQQPFDASGWPIELSGLLGPIELVPMRRVSGVRS
ncbi:MAG TPA: glycosyl hydrolase [Vicinamibacterales bacterium]|nr:glycosyl hydrolase [Vicinamibacterales bacterium]